MKSKDFLENRVVQPHLRIREVREYVLLPGDPDRIDMMLKHLKNIKEISNNRGFRVCEGEYNNIPISLVSSGIGCPSAAIVVEELVKAGAKTIIRVGTCGGLSKGMEAGDIVIPTMAMCLDGTTREYNPKITKIEASKEVFESLVKSAKKFNVRYFTGMNRTHDAFYEPTKNFIGLSGKGFISSEMECSSVFMVSQLRGIRAGAILVVNTPEPPEEVALNPSIIYKLVDQERVKKGIEDAIQISLEAINRLESDLTR